MFQKGNRLSQGRPRISLTKPELLLPVIFNKASINWQNDFMKLYRALRERELTMAEYKHMKLLLEILPYLCTKVQLKEIDNQKLTAGADAAAASKQTSKLLEEFEKETNGLKSNPPAEGNS